MKAISPTMNGAWLLCQDSNIYLINDELPQGLARHFCLQNKLGVEIGQWRGLPLYLVFAEFPELEYCSLRTQLDLPEHEFNLLNRGVALKHFWQRHQFCGCCRTATKPVISEWALQCSNESCKQRFYPVICPSIIVAVRRDNEILLANHVRHKESQIYTAIAGFVEVGETFEQAVAREVFEETGIQIQNLRYFASQPWAFPNSLMVGFLADYKSGEIQLQEAEIHDARWFKADQPLPTLPAAGTIAYKLIQASLALCNQSQN